MAKLLCEWMPLKSSSELIKESREQNGGKLILRGILQKANTVNQNNRIYPYEILKREVENYQKEIREGRAVGECVPAGTKILTHEKGWLNIENVHAGDLIYTLNLKTNKIEIQPIEEKIDRPYSEKMVRIFNDSGRVDMTLTQNHKVLLWNRYNEPYEMSAIELYEAIKRKDEIIPQSYLRDFDQVVGHSEISLYKQSLLAELIDLSGDRVYCVRVANKNWLMKQGRNTCWTHNCDHPESPTVSLKNVSHRVVEMGWEGFDVVGAIEILPTPSGKILESLVESGVTIGISSRGVGSTEKDFNGNDIVQEDFQLVCLDAVTTPSTSGAYLHENKQIDLKQIKMSKGDRIWRALNNILVK